LEWIAYDLARLQYESRLNPLCLEKSIFEFKFQKFLRSFFVCFSSCSCFLFSALCLHEQIGHRHVDAARKGPAALEHTGRRARRLSKRETRGPRAEQAHRPCVWPAGLAGRSWRTLTKHAGLRPGGAVQDGNPVYLLQETILHIFHCLRSVQNMMNGSDQKLMEEGWFSARGCIRRSGTRGGAWLAIAG